MDDTVVHSSNIKCPSSAVSGRESGLDRDGWVKCDQPATLPVAVLGPRAGRIAPVGMDKVDAALRFVFDLA